MDDELSSQLLRAILPALIVQLLASGQLDRKHLTDVPYLLSQINRSLHLVDALHVNVTLDDQLIASAREAIEKNRPAVATVLAAAVVEHRVNRFYRDIYDLRGEWSEEVDCRLRNTSMREKTGVYLQELTGRTLPDSLLQRILELYNLRNDFAHYWPRPAPLSTRGNPWYDALCNRVARMGHDGLLELPDEVETELERIRRVVEPDYDEALRVTEALLSGGD